MTPTPHQPNLDTNTEKKMTPAEFAATLTNSTYRAPLTHEQCVLAKKHGLVIVYGQSDDLMEFDGAFRDEFGAYEGATVRVDRAGPIPHFDDVDRDDKDALRDYFKRENNGKEIEALWCAEEGYSWTYKTDIPHATFEITEDGEPYCRGIVFALADLEAA